MSPSRYDSSLSQASTAVAPVTAPVTGPVTGGDSERVMSQSGPCQTSSPPDTGDRVIYDEEFKAFLKAFQREASMTNRDLSEFEGTTIEDVKAVVVAIQQKQLSANKQLYMKRLEVFLVSMENYGKVIEAFLNASDFLAFVWGPLKFMLLTACNFSEALNALLDAYMQIGELIPQLHAYQRHCVSNEYMRTVLALMYKDILEFHAVAFKYFRKKSWRKIFQAVWSGFVVKLRELREKLQQHRRLVESQASIAQFEEAQRLRQDMETRFKDIQAQFLRGRWQEVHRWLSAHDANLDQQRCAEAKSECPGSGQWLLEDDRFKNWMDPIYCQNPLLWLNGIAGAGKTILTSTIVEALQRQCENGSMRLAFFYCKDFKDRNTFVAVAKSLLSQLARNNPDLVLQLYDKGNLNSGEAILSNPSMAKDLLEVTLDSPKTTYIVIDGIDECVDREERKLICSWFVQQVNHLPKEDFGSLRCLFVSRDDGPAKKDLGNLLAINMRTTGATKDIKNYIFSWVKKIEAKHGLLDPQQHPVADIIMAGTQGMFLFAKLAVRFLHELHTRQDLLQNIQPGQFPEEIGELYDKILKQIIDEKPGAAPKNKRVSTLLNLLVCAKRPLRWYEIQGFFAFDENDDEFVDHEKRQLRDAPGDMCLSLVEHQFDDSVQLVHPTAEVHLIKSQYVKLHQAEYEITRQTLAFLCIPATTLKEASLPSRFIINGYYSFLDYAVACWSLHLQAAAAEVDSPEKLAELAEYVGNFLDIHWSSAAAGVTVSGTIKERLKGFQAFDCHQRLIQAIISARKQLGVHGKGPSPGEPLDLSQVIQTIRPVYEGMVESSDHSTALELQQFYGKNSFKCPRMNCIRFYDGYSTRSERDRHVDKHERPYTCGIPDCSMAIVGYSTEKALQKHLFELHGLDSGSNVHFPAPPREMANKTTGGIFRCSHCPKTFTRAFTRKCHERTHSNSRPFACGTCPKSFARSNDLRRHETIHSSHRTFICNGKLKDGTRWGCQKTFPRSDKLHDHFQSSIGRRCIAMHWAEQEKNDRGPPVATSSQDAAVVPLEAGLIQQDMEMTDAQWEALFESCVEMEEDKTDT